MGPQLVDKILYHQICKSMNRFMSLIYLDSIEIKAFEFTRLNYEVVMKIVISATGLSMWMDPLKFSYVMFSLSNVIQ